MKLYYIRNSKTGQIVTAAFCYNYESGQWTELSFNGSQPFFSERKEYMQEIVDGKYNNSYSIDIEYDVLLAIKDKHLEVVGVNL